MTVALGNATEAARLAGYSGGRDALGVRGNELMSNPKVLAAIELKRAELAERDGYSVDRWRREVVGRFGHCIRPRDGRRPRGAALDETNAKGYAELLGRHVASSPQWRGAGGHRSRPCYPRRPGGRRGNRLPLPFTGDAE